MQIEELLATPETEDQVQGGLFWMLYLERVWPSSSCLSSKMSCCWCGGGALFVPDLGLDILDGVTGLYLQGDGPAGQGLHKDLGFDLLTNVMKPQTDELVETPRYREHQT